MQVRDSSSWQALQLSRCTKILGSELKSSWCDYGNVANICLGARAGGRPIKGGRSEQEVAKKRQARVTEEQVERKRRGNNWRELDGTTMMR